VAAIAAAAMASVLKDVMVIGFVDVVVMACPEISGSFAICEGQALKLGRNHRSVTPCIGENTCGPWKPGAI
jgi:hypothetical protein